MDWTNIEIKVVNKSERLRGGKSLMLVKSINWEPKKMMIQTGFLTS